MQQLQVNSLDAAKTKSACIKKDFLQRNDVSGVTWCWIHQVTGEGQQKTVSLISLLWGPAMQSCPAISERVEFTRLTRWLSPHQGNGGNSRAEQCLQWGEVEMSKRPSGWARTGGLRAGSCWLPPGSGCSKATFALWDGCIQKTALHLSPLHPWASQARGGELNSFLIISLLPNFTRRNKVTDTSPTQRPPLLLGLHPILKAVLYILAKKKVNRSWCYWDFWQRNDTQVPCQGHGKERQVYPGHWVCQTTFQAFYLGLPETVETRWINNCKTGFVILAEPKGIKLKLKTKKQTSNKVNQKNKRKIKATLQEVPKDDKNGLEKTTCLQSLSFFSQVCL